MAQTKRKRRSKHRGTAAGSIETRGRTGRPPSADERKKMTREQLREKRLSSPPTWRASVTRAALASALMFVFLLIISKKDRLVIAAGFAVFALILYVPTGYYMELWMYKRRMRRKAAEGK